MLLGENLTSHFLLCFRHLAVRFLFSCLTGRARSSPIVCARTVSRSCSHTHTRHGLLARKFAQPQLNRNTKKSLKPTQHFLVKLDLYFFAIGFESSKRHVKRRTEFTLC